ncbi:MAG: LysE family translocator [Chitinophagaceae bacterium]|nr:LysE family translocator [Chitinophagaceae bacterium]
MPFSELIIYIVFVIGFALTPGPNMMLFLTYTFEYGRKAGWATATGIVCAFVVHITAVVLGLSTILVAMPHALEILRFAGIGYLFFLAIRNLKKTEWKNTEDLSEKYELKQFFYKGLISNILNPGSLFLYFSLIPQFIHPERGHFLAQNLVLGGLQMIFSFLTNCSIVFFAGYLTQSFFNNEKYQRWVRYTMSLLIILFALQMLYIKKI